ncbi:cation transporter dimerization domain-containing protein, partial [Acinetobacter pittii]|uniref:cation transporter dimerization domain-containing protein n=1 Tax=Acinetobacter pittii TaxID=48296 RepID=UPI001BDBAEF0
VETHIEPLQAEMLAGGECDPALVTDIAQALSTLAAETGLIEDVHSVRARSTEAGLVVIYHCRADPGLPVSRVHEAVDQVERRFRRT